VTALTGWFARAHKAMVPAPWVGDGMASRDNRRDRVILLMEDTPPGS
jgi:hypothetical protein